MLRVEKIVEQSKVPTTTLAEYSLLPREPGMVGMGGEERPAQIILTDVGVELRFRQADRKSQQLWFGDFLSRSYLNETGIHPNVGWFWIRQRGLEATLLFPDGVTAKKFADQFDNAISAWRKRFPEACKDD
jgi:hypothetical protein